MIDIEILRNEKTREAAVTSLAKRGVELSHIEALLAADSSWREATQALEEVRAQKKQSGDKIVSATPEEKQTIIASMQELGEKESSLKEAVDSASQERDVLWKKIPNIP